MDVNELKRLEEQEKLQKLRYINSTDVDAWRALRRYTDGDPSLELTTKVYNALKKERHLDKELKPIRADKTEGLSSGVKVYYRNSLNSLETTDAKYGEVLFQGKSIKCDIETIKVLKALVRTGITKNELLADAVAELFKRILLLVIKGKSLKEELTLVEKEDYYIEQLKEAIIEQLNQGNKE